MQNETAVRVRVLKEFRLSTRAGAKVYSPGEIELFSAKEAESLARFGWVAIMGRGYKSEAPKKETPGENAPRNKKEIKEEN